MGVSVLSSPRGTGTQISKCCFFFMSTLSILSWHRNKFLQILETLLCKTTG